MELDTLQIKISYELVNKIKSLIHSYINVFKHKPKGIAVNPYDYLVLLTYLKNIQRVEEQDKDNKIQIEGAMIFAKANGYPEIILHTDDVVQFQYLKEKNHKSIMPLLLTA